MNHLYLLACMFNILFFNIFLHSEELSNVKALPTKYKMIDLNTNAEESSALAINEKDQVLGVMRQNNKNYLFIWEKKKPLTVLNLPIDQDEPIDDFELDFFFSTQYKFNNLGQIAGIYSSDEGYMRTFIWDKKTGFIDIGTLNEKRTYIDYFNDKGQIIGHSLVNDEMHEYFYENGHMIDLTNLFMEQVAGEWRSVHAYDLNNHGCVILTAFEKNESTKSYLWDQKSFQQLLPEQPSDTSVFVSWMDDKKNMIVELTDAKGVEKNIFINAKTGKIYDLPSENDGKFYPGDWILRNSFPVHREHLPGSIKKDFEGNEYITIGVEIHKLLIGKLPFSDVKDMKFTKIQDQNSKNHFVGHAQTIYSKPQAFIAVPE
jgi:hypothetical protein